MPAAGGLLADEEPTVQRGGTETLCLRWSPPPAGDTSCGTDQYLSTRRGNDDVICTQVYATAVTNTFTTRDFDGLTLDAGGSDGEATSVTGQIQLSPALGAVNGVAVADVTIRVSGRVGTRTETLAQHTESVVVTPATMGLTVAFEQALEADLDLAELTSATSSVTIDGPQVLPWDFTLNGESFVEIPQAVVAG